MTDPSHRRTLAFDRHGPEPASAARVVVMLHGFLGSGRNLGALARALAAREACAVLIPDLPGHGRSPPLEPGADLASLARAVCAFAASVLGERSFELVGHSLGGRVALAALEEPPHRVERATLLDITPSAAAPDLGLGAETLPHLLRAPASFRERGAAREHFRSAGFSAGFTDWLLMNLVAAPDGGLVWRVDRGALAALLPRVLGVDLWPIVERQKARLTLVRGGSSTSVSDEDARRFEAVTGRAVVTLAGATHFVHVDQPQAVLALLGGPG